MALCGAPASPPPPGRMPFAPTELGGAPPYNLLMRIRHLRLSDYRNFQRLDVYLASGVSIDKSTSPDTSAAKLICALRTCSRRASIPCF